MMAEAADSLPGVAVVEGVASVKKQRKLYNILRNTEIVDSLSIHVHIEKNHTLNLLLNFTQCLNTIFF